MWAAPVRGLSPYGTRSTLTRGLTGDDKDCEARLCYVRVN